LKKKEKKRKEKTYLTYGPTFQPGQPTGPLNLFPQRPTFPFFFFFFVESLTIGAHLSAPPSPSSSPFLPLPRPVERRRSRPRLLRFSRVPRPSLLAYYGN
jgi:hypothetical protein